MCLFDFTSIQVNQSAWKTAGNDALYWKAEWLLGTLLHDQTKSSYQCADDEALFLEGKGGGGTPILNDSGTYLII